MDGSREYCAKWNKSDRERQIPYDFICMCNLGTNKWTNKQTHRYREQTSDCQMGGSLGGLWEKGKEIKKYKLVVTK